MFISVTVNDASVILKKSNIRKVKKTERGCEIFFMRKNDYPLKTESPFYHLDYDLRGGFIHYNTAMGGLFLIRKTLINKVIGNETGCELFITHPKEVRRQITDSQNSIYLQLMGK